MLEDTETEQVNDESAETTYHILHHQVPPSVPPSPEGSRTLDLVVTSEKPSRSSPSPQIQSQQSGSTSKSCRTVRGRNVAEDHPDTDTGLTASPQTVREILQQQRKSPDRQTHDAAAGTGGSGAFHVLSPLARFSQRCTFTSSDEE